MKMKNIRSARSKEKTKRRVSVNFITDGIRSFPHDERGKRCTKSVTIPQGKNLNETFRVIKVDRSLLDYYQKLTTLYGQFRSVGVNYNRQ